jgi:hypothetical protein
MLRVQPTSRSHPTGDFPYLDLPLSSLAWTRD